MKVHCGACGETLVEDDGRYFHEVIGDYEPHEPEPIGDAPSNSA